MVLKQQSDCKKQDVEWEIKVLRSHDVYTTGIVGIHVFHPWLLVPCPAVKVGLASYEVFHWLVYNFIKSWGVYEFHGDNMKWLQLLTV